MDAKTKADLTNYPQFAAAFSPDSEFPFFGFCFPGEHDGGAGFLVFIPLNADLADYPPEADGYDVDYLKLETPAALQNA